jgi:hypothetical protein
MLSAVVKAHGNINKQFGDNSVKKNITNIIMHHNKYVPNCKTFSSDNTHERELDYLPAQ